MANVSGLREMLDASVNYVQGYSNAVNNNKFTGWMPALIYYYCVNAPIWGAQSIYNFTKDSHGTYMDESSTLLYHHSGWGTLGASTNVNNIMRTNFAYGNTGLRALHQDIQFRKKLDASNVSTPSGVGLGSAGIGTGTFKTQNVSLVNIVLTEYNRTSNWYGRSEGDGNKDTFKGSQNGNQVSIGSAAPAPYNPPAS